MTKLSRLKSLSDTEFIKLINNSYSKAEICQSLDLTYSGISTNIIKTRMNSLNLKFKPKYKYKRITKTCPVCSNLFETYNGSKGEKQTCSYSCSNTYFRSGSNNGMYNKHSNGSSHYRTKCFLYHKKECIICNENRIVAVHHIDKNHNNNSKENLIPLCPHSSSTCSYK